MTTKELFIISSIPGVGKMTLKHFANYIESNNVSTDMNFSPIEEIFNELRGTNKKIKVPLRSEFEMAQKKGERVIEESDRNDVKMMSILDKDFPENLRDIPNSPVILHYVGSKAAYQNKCVAVIGTREPSMHGERMGKRLADFYVDADFTIVSGLAIGCDTIAHTAAVEKGKPTIAILAGGLQSIYPKQNRELAEEILSHDGLLISEYEYGSPSNKNFFVERDRLQSGISEGIIVIETGLKGGTRHTVQAAYDQKRLIGCLYTHAGNQFNLMSEEKFQGNIDIVRTQNGYKLDSKESLLQYQRLLEERYNRRVNNNPNAKVENPPKEEPKVKVANEIKEPKIETKEDPPKEESVEPKSESKESTNTGTPEQLKIFNDNNI